MQNDSSVVRLKMFDPIAINGRRYTFIFFKQGMRNLFKMCLKGFIPPSFNSLVWVTVRSPLESSIVRCLLRRHKEARTTATLSKKRRAREQKKWNLLNFIKRQINLPYSSYAKFIAVKKVQYPA